MTNITPYLNRLDILNETVRQIIKDFRMAGLVVTFSGNPDTVYTELFLQIYPIVNKFLTKRNELYTLFYRIDLSEKQINKAMESSGDRSISEALTNLIIKRELQKVLTRKMYSKKGDV